MSTLQRTRLAGAWTRLGPNNKPLGRLHAARRIDGTLSSEALCGFKVPATIQRRRPYPTFDETHRKACSVCVVESWSVRS